MSNNKLNQHKLTVHIRYESTEYVKFARIVFETKVSLTRQGRGPSADTRDPNQLFSGRPNFVTNLILGIFYLT